MMSMLFISKLHGTSFVLPLLVYLSLSFLYLSLLPAHSADIVHLGKPCTARHGTARHGGRRQAPAGVRVGKEKGAE
jgi:hypothetical protein